MADKGEKPDFEQIDDLFGEDSTGNEPLADAAMSADASLDPLGDQGGGLLDLEGLGSFGDDGLGGLAAESALTAEEAEQTAGDAEDDPKKKKKQKKQKQKKEKKPKDDRGAKPEADRGSFLETLQNTSPYTVMLAMALLAIVIALFCLVMEWKTYDFDTFAKDYKRQAGIVPAVQLGPATTAVAACPDHVRLTSNAGAAVDESGLSWMT